MANLKTPSVSNFDDIVTDRLWTRIRRGPSALENPQIRARIVKGGFSLKHVKPNVRTTVPPPPPRPEVQKSLTSKQSETLKKECEREDLRVRLLRSVASFPQKQLNHVVPKVSQQAKVVAAPTPRAALLTSITRFDQNSLQSVQTRVTRQTVVRSTVSECNKKVLEAIVRFDKKQLRRASTRVTRQIVVRPTLSECSSKVREAVVRFDKKSLRKVNTRVSHSPVVLPTPKVTHKPAANPNPIPPAPKATPSVKASAPATSFEKNLILLEQLGFGDRKRNISALVANGNELQEALLTLVSA